MATIKVMLTAVLLATGLAACVFQEPGVYRGNGELVRPGPLGIQDLNSFHFVNKWLISHRWLSGPTDIRLCGYGDNPFLDRYEGNPFPDRAEWRALSKSLSAPFFEVDGKLLLLTGVSMRTKKWSLSHRDQKIYGTNPEGKFIGYSSFCGHAFADDTLDGVYINIVEPDPAKGTDEWIKGAQPVVINGLQWLRKTEPIKDWTDNPKRAAAPIETWVLKIPQTKYWMRLGLNSGSGATNPYQKGAVHYPEKHARIVELFHELVRSVKLEPIEPVDISALLEAQDNKAGKR